MLKSKDQHKAATYWSRKLNQDCSDVYMFEKYFFSDMLQLARNSNKILEVGVGTGRMVKALRKHGVTADFYGIDFSDNVFASNTIAQKGDARNLPYDDNAFDLVYSLGVVEHFPETAEAISEHCRVVRQGGHVIVTSPHLCLITPVRYLLYFLRGEFRSGTFEEIRGRNLRLKYIIESFESTGLEVVRAGVSGMFMLDRILYNRLPTLYDPGRVNFHQHPLIGSHLYCIGKKK